MALQIHNQEQETTKMNENLECPEWNDVECYGCGIVMMDVYDCSKCSTIYYCDECGGDTEEDFE